MSMWKYPNKQCCASWLVLPTVYSDALSYGEQLDKFCYALNQVIENNNFLPTYVQQMIQEYISSGAIGEVVQDIIGQFILNVKYPPEGITPAVGDGSSDDTAAIQGCIDYAAKHNGMAVYFPSGSYLTQPLTIKNRVAMFGFDRYSTRVVLRGGATAPLLSGSADEISISGITLDGNMDIQVNNIDLIDITVGSGIITNAVLTDGYDVLKVTVNDNLQLSDVVIESAVVHSCVLNGAGKVNCDNVFFNSLSTLNGEAYIVLNTSDSILHDLHFIGTVPSNLIINGDGNIVTAMSLNSAGYEDNGTNNSVKFYGKDNTESYSGKYMLVCESLAESVSGNASKTATTLHETVTDAATKTYGALNEAVSGTVTKKTKNLVETTTETATKTAKAFNFKSDTFKIDTPKITYSKPVAFSNFSDYIPMLDTDNTDYQLLVANEKTKILQNDYMTPEYFGAKGDGVTDDTAALQNSVNYCHENGLTLKSSNGKVYLISAPITITNEWPILNTVDFGNATIKASANMEACLIINGHANGGFISNIQIDCNSKNCVGLLINDSLHIVLDNIRILNIATLGVRVVAGYEILFSNSELWGVGSSAVGFEINTSDSVYFNITGVNLHIGFSRTGPSNYFNHIHFWIADTVPAEAVQNSVLFKVVDNYCTFSNVESDTYHYTFQLSKEVIIIVNNLYFFISNNVINSERTPGLTPEIFNCSDPKNTKSVYVNGCYGYGGPVGADHFCNTNFYGRAEGLTLIGFTDIIHENFIAALLPSYSADVSALQGFATICGSTYELSLHLQLDNTVAGDKMIFTLPENSRPANPIYGMCGLSAASYKVHSAGYLFIDSTTGNCTINIPELTGTVYATIHITFICQNGAYSGQ